jgi:hypothetical protein
MNARTSVPGDLAAPETAENMTRVGGRLLWPALLYVPALLLLLAVAVAAATTGIPPQKFLLDPAVLAGSHPLLGVVSNIGILIWAATAAIALFTATLLGMKRQEPEHKVFLLAAGLLTSWLVLDDFFMIHEWLFPHVLGVPQTLVLAAYAGLAGCFLLRFAALILRTDFLLLALALAFLSVSVCVDALPNTWFAAWNWLYLIEDGFKLLGIVGWFGYCSHVCASFLGARAS